MSHDDVKICRLIADIATKPIMETVVNMTLIRFAATDTVYTFMELLSDCLLMLTIKLKGGFDVHTDVKEITEKNYLRLQER